MNYSEIADKLATATVFDLFRIKIAIEKMLNDPERIFEVKRRLRQGQQVEYFLPEENRSRPAVVIELKRARVLLKNVDDGVLWNIPYCYVNLEGVDTRIASPTAREGLDRNEVQVGDRVGFVDQENIERYGEIVRLNPKSVTLNCEGLKWRVPYSFLFKVIGQDIECLPEL